MTERIEEVDDFDDRVLSVIVNRLGPNPQIGQTTNQQNAAQRSRLPWADTRERMREIRKQMYGVVGGYLMLVTMLYCLIADLSFNSSTAEAFCHFRWCPPLLICLIFVKDFIALVPLAFEYVQLRRKMSAATAGWITSLPDAQKPKEGWWRRVVLVKLNSCFPLLTTHWHYVILVGWLVPVLAFTLVILQEVTVYPCFNKDKYLQQHNSTMHNSTDLSKGSLRHGG